jgi:hypothetical protein
MQIRDQDDEEFDDDGELLDEPDLGPDERDADLLDGSWEQRQYTKPARRGDWEALKVGVALVVVAALVLPMLLVLFQ